MEKMVCENCISFDKENSFQESGYCQLWEDYVADDNTCEEFEDNPNVY